MDGIHHLYFKKKSSKHVKHFISVTTPGHTHCRLFWWCYASADRFTDLMTSWTSTVFMDCSYITGNFSITIARSTVLGICSRITLAVSSITCTQNQMRISISMFEETEWVTVCMLTTSISSTGFTNARKIAVSRSPMALSRLPLSLLFTCSLQSHIQYFPAFV